MKKRLIPCIIFIVILFIGCNKYIEICTTQIFFLNHTEKYLFHEICIDEQGNHYYIENNSIIKADVAKRQIIKIKTVSDNYKLRNLILGGENLYYISWDDNEIFNICSIDLNGKNEVILLTQSNFSNELLNKITWSNNKLYIQMNFAFYCYDIMENALIQLFDDVGIYHIKDNQLYFIDHANRTFTIYQVNLDTKERICILGDGIYRDKSEEYMRYKNFIFIGDDMYYSTSCPGSIYRYRDGVHTLVYKDEGINEFSLQDCHGYLYFSITKEETHLIKYDPNTQELFEVN